MSLENSTTSNVNVSSSSSVPVGCNRLESRKTRKPKIEKLRRARINSSLESLKEILLRNTISIPQGSRPTKLEKADILEMSVRYIELLHENLSKSSKTSTTDRNLKPERRIFTEITNRKISYSHRQQHTHHHVKENEKFWLFNRTKMILEHEHDESLQNHSDKENNNKNFIDVVAQQQSMLKDDHHWRPW